MPSQLCTLVMWCFPRSADSNMLLVRHGVKLCMDVLLVLPIFDAAC